MTEATGIDAVLFRRVRPGNAFEETVARLLQAVRLGVIRPGESLPSERELAASLAVGRDTVREAIRVLAEAGYLESRRGRYGGTFVREHVDGLRPPADAPVSGFADVDDVLGLRAILEIGAVRATAGRTLSAADRDLLWSRMLESAAAGGEDYRRIDSRLHLAIGELTGVPSLLPLLVEVRDRTNALLDAIPLLAPNIAHSNAQHEAIVQAILRGDADAAARAMSEHLDGTAALLHAFLD
jgi:GntR family transcriptional regulator, transcriptional repressor for pyruvate dehydrogenase complex